MDASSDNPNAAPAPSTFFDWHPPEKRLTVYLNVEVCDGLGPRVTEGLKSLPRRGLEVGGLLLGWVDKGGELSVIVQDFEPFEAEHVRGPSYSLSDADRGRLEQRIEYWQSNPAGLSVVGYYRSHTRPGRGCRSPRRRRRRRRARACTARTARPGARWPCPSPSYVRRVHLHSYREEL